MRKFEIHNNNEGHEDEDEELNSIHIINLSKSLQFIQSKSINKTIIPSNFSSSTFSHK